ncbi:transmembrane protein 138 isoform X2 [Physeter macrocephalus]|uniref:Transmembrane protein 138 n=1 Tax=Physeter macrocephalus TaxID=9755 RepID=A0A455C9B2_PHYMC|nr:transmembrane protein 138 isoform X2 [Physeter catodon]|eukprot:XP_028357008.1 transmembrane protein 138 isoform X4 [Physeter catodon]
MKSRAAGVAGRQGPCLRARETALILRNYSFSVSAWESTRTAFWELWNVPLGAQDSRRKMLQTSNYSLVLSLQFLLLSYDLFVNSFSELLRMAPVIQLVLFITQDVAVLFNVVVIFLTCFNTFVFQAGLVSLLFHKCKGTIILTAVYFALSISLHVWVMELSLRFPRQDSDHAELLRTYAGKTPTALSGQMDFRRYLYSRD